MTDKEIPEIEATCWQAINRAMSAAERETFNEWMAALWLVGDRIRDISHLNSSSEYFIEQANVLMQMLNKIPRLVDDSRKSSSYTYPVKFSSTDNYGCGPDDEDDVYTVEEFKENCRVYAFIDDDGFGYPVKDGKADESVLIYPSEVDEIPKDATHIVWFNK